MLRALLVGILAATAATVGCGKDASPQLAPNAAAGKVVEASGKVSALRNGATRVLTVGNEVYGDDVIDTASDGSVVIELFHNNARWAVDGSLKARVDESVAWGLAKQDTPTKLVEHATSAAGRNAERQGADTRSSTERGGESPKPDKPQPVVAAASDPSPTPAPAAAAPAAKIESAPKGTISDGKAKDLAPVRRSPAQKPPTATKAPKPRDIDDVLGSSAPSPGAPSAGSAAQHGEDSSDAANRFASSKRVALKSCLEADGKLKLVVHVAKGAATVELAPAPSAAVRACIEGIVKSFAFPSSDLTFTVSVVK
jgi:hypothetical protein